MEVNKSIKFVAESLEPESLHLWILIKSQIRQSKSLQGHGQEQ